MRCSDYAVRTFVLITLFAAFLPAQARIPSPDGKLYAVEGRGRKVGKGEERQRFSIFTLGGRLVSVLHIWLTEPDGSRRLGIRGCESSEWIDSNRFFCEGSINPSTGVHRWFDARSGKELGEGIGSNFAWSPDGRTLANFGNVPHFSNADHKSDSLEVGTHLWPNQSSSDSEQHWFRSAPSWSPDSKYIAVVDHQRRIRKAFFLEIVDAKTGERTEHKLRWADEADEWNPPLDFVIRWDAGKVTVRRADMEQTFVR